MEMLSMITEGISLIQSEKPKKIGVYYPSSITYCIRKEYYSYLEAEHHSLETHKNFAVGSAFHIIVQNALNYYAKAHPEIKTINELEADTEEERQKIREEFYYKEGDIELHGRPDTIIMTPDGTKHILEIKSHGNLMYLKEASHNHILQLNYYLSKEYISDGNILYMNKAKKTNGEEYEEFREFADIKYDHALFKELVGKARELHESLIHKELPEPEGYNRGGINDWECKGCPARIRCFKEIMNSNG